MRAFGKKKADAALESAEEAASADGSDSAMTDTVARQRLSCGNRRQTRRERGATTDRCRDKRAEAHSTPLHSANANIWRDRQKQRGLRQFASTATATTKTADDRLQRCDLLERALDVHTADQQARDAQAAVDNEAVLRSAWKRLPANGRSGWDGALRLQFQSLRFSGRCAGWPENSPQRGVRSKSGWW